MSSESKQMIREYFKGTDTFGHYLTVRAAQKRMARRVAAELEGTTDAAEGVTLHRCLCLSTMTFND